MPIGRRKGCESNVVVQKSEILNKRGLTPEKRNFCFIGYGRKEVFYRGMDT